MTTRQNHILIYGKPCPLKWLSGKVLSGIILILLFLLPEFNASGQVQAVGHIFAEIVEPTALSADTNNDHYILKNEKPSDNDLILAEVKLSGKNVNIDVSIHSGDLRAANGETLQFEAFACPSCIPEDSSPYGGEKLFTLIGTPGETFPKDNKSTFNGEYQVVFLYN